MANIIIHQNFSLKNYNTFSIEITCKYFAEIFTVEDLQYLIQDVQFANTPKMILGGGSNILFTQNFEGLIIKNSIKGINIIQEDENHVYVKVAAGENWHQLVKYALINNYAGIENLSLIPGQVGAAPMQNIGAYGVEIESVFHQLEAINLSNGHLEIFDKTDCKFGYRESIFKKELKGKFCITSVTFCLNKHPTINSQYGAIQQVLNDMNITQPTIQDISAAVIKIRTSKLPNPKEFGNAGSFFKNPEITITQFQSLQQQYPNIPHYPTTHNLIKIPAGWLIEQCGFKGKKIGNTGAHAQQALVLVNYGNATGKEIYQLALQIQQNVQQKFGIAIEAEVNLV